MKRIFLIIAVAAVVFAGCDGRSKQSGGDILMVSIEPLKYLVDNITGNDFEVEVLLPAGSGPETYEPAPAQIKSAEDARLLFFTGLIDFETGMVKRFADKGRFVDLSAGIELIEGTCSHDGHTDGHDHSHGVDPHIWTSPKALLLMAETAYERIHELYPDSLSYTDNYNVLRGLLEVLDDTVGRKIEASGRRAFMIFHPGLTYYARDYGLEQIAIEQDGKEPSARQLQEIVEEARAENITRILYQSEFPKTVVQVAAAETGAETVEIDILGYDVAANILTVTDLIVTQ